MHILRVQEFANFETKTVRRDFRHFWFLCLNLWLYHASRKSLGLHAYRRNVLAAATRDTDFLVFYARHEYVHFAFCMCGDGSGENASFSAAQIWLSPGARARRRFAETQRKVRTFGMHAPFTWKFVLVLNLVAGNSSAHKFSPKLHFFSLHILISHSNI